MINEVYWQNGLTGETRWHMGYIIGIPTLAFIVLVLLALTVYAIFKYRDDNSYGDWGVGIFTGVLMILVAAGLLAGAAFPWSTEYHKYFHVQGEVEQVSSRLIPADKGVQQRFVVVVGGKPYGVDDTRASLVKPGQSIDLWCSKDWQYIGEPGWACDWGDGTQYG